MSNNSNAFQYNKQNIIAYIKGEKVKWVKGVMGTILVPNRVTPKDIKSCIAGEMSSPKTGAIYYHVPDKGRAIKWLSAIAGMFVPLDLLNSWPYVIMSRPMRYESYVLKGENFMFYILPYIMFLNAKPIQI